MSDPALITCNVTLIVLGYHLVYSIQCILVQKLGSTRRLRIDDVQCHESVNPCDCSQAALECKARGRSGRTQDLAQDCHKGMVLAWNLSGRRRQ